MKHSIQLILLIIALSGSNVIAQNYTVGVPVDDTLLGNVFTNVSHNCYPQYDHYLGFLSGAPTGVETILIFTNVSPLNTVYTDPGGIVNTGDTLHFSQSMWFKFYLPGTSSVSYYFKAIGTPQIAGETYHCGNWLGYNLLWSCQNMLSYGYTDSCTVSPPIPCISGYVTYDNSISTPINNCSVQLINGNDTLVQTTDNLGFYRFNDVQNGTYQLKAKCLKPLGGVNSNDALKVLHYFVGSSTLSPLRALAAGVAGKNYINSTDAFLIMKRFVGITNSFLKGNWLFESKTITVNGQSVTNANLKGICYGDVDGTNIPPP